jgi:hypothetical protein
VARGYWNRPDLTAERFVPDPFSPRPGARLFRTGDMVRQGVDDGLEFLGRRDQQVKLRGFRVELGEIATALQRHVGVRHAHVIVRDDEAGVQQLVAYIIPQSSHGVGARELREHLAGQLPAYMVPAAFVTLDAFPLTPNGKIDHRALPAPGSVQRETIFVEPRTAIEEVLSGIWAQVLGVTRVGVSDNFFQLGGHSLLATQVVSRVRKLLRTDLPLYALFEKPTIAELSQAILDTARDPGDVERVAKAFVLVKNLPGEEVSKFLVENSR